MSKPNAKIPILLVLGSLALGVWAYWLWLRPVNVEILEGVVLRSRPLILAISKYEQDRGVPPPDLKALVPRYRSRIPAPGLNSAAAYSYEAGNSIPGGRDNPWMLWVGVDNDSRLIYLPLQNYRPDRPYEYQRVGDWDLEIAPD